MTVDQLLFIVILAATFALFVSERLRADVTAMLALLALVVTGLLDTKEALSGFSSEPAIIVAAVFVISGGLAATGVTERIGLWIGRAAGKGEARAIGVVMPAVALLASFTHHVMVTAMMLPILLRHARERALPASRLLMPMSLAASLGTTLTLVSAPAFLLADELLERNGAGLDIFSITPIGIALVVTGAIYMQLVRWLLPRRSGQDDGEDYLRLDRYRTELRVVPESRWATRPFRELDIAYGRRLTLVAWLRDGTRRDDLVRTSAMLSGDVLIVDTGGDELLSMHKDSGLDLAPLHAEDFATDAAQPPELVQAVVAPGSEFIGRSLGELAVSRSFGATVIGLWRRAGALPVRLTEAVLREGDLLVLRGASGAFNELSRHHGVLLLVPFAGQAKRRLHAPVALGILLTTIVVAVFEWLPAHLAFLAGAVAMVATGCVDIRQAYRGIDVRIFVMIAGVIPLGMAMQETGTADLLARILEHVMAGWPPLAILLVLFAAAALLTQILSDSATTVLLAPVALALATALQLPPTPFVVVTALGAVVAFLTPIGHHGNLLILGPGQYRFGDFLRVGLPLTLMIATISAWMAQWLWLDGPLVPTLPMLGIG